MGNVLPLLVGPLPLPPPPLRRARREKLLKTLGLPAHDVRVVTLDSDRARRLVERREPVDMKGMYMIEVDVRSVEKMRRFFVLRLRRLYRAIELLRAHDAHAPQP